MKHFIEEFCKEGRQKMNILQKRLSIVKMGDQSMNQFLNFLFQVPRPNKLNRDFLVVFSSSTTFEVLVLTAFSC